MASPNRTLFCPFCFIFLEDIKKGVHHSPFIIDECNVRSGYFDRFVWRSAEGLFYVWECYARSGKEGLVIYRVSLMSLHFGLGLGKNLLDDFEMHAIEVDRQICHFKG